MILFQSDGIIKLIIEKTYLLETDLQQSWAFEAETDPMNFDQKQTQPTTEELEKAQAEQNQLRKKVYQKVHQNIKLLGLYLMKKTIIHMMNKMYFQFFILKFIFIYFRILKMINKI